MMAFHSDLQVVLVNFLFFELLLSLSYVELCFSAENWNPSRQHSPRFLARQLALFSPRKWEPLWETSRQPC